MGVEALGEKMKLHHIKAPLAAGKTCMSHRVFGRLPRISRPCLPGLRYSRALVLGLLLNFTCGPLISTSNSALGGFSASSPEARQMDQDLDSIERGHVENSC